MRIIARNRLRAYGETHADAREQLEAWYEVVSQVEWESFADVRATYGNASVVANNRIVFNIKGNDYRLIVRMDYRGGIAFIHWFGSHAEYDKIDAATVGMLEAEPASRRQEKGRGE